jgi:hypothetical protein
MPKGEQIKIDPTVPREEGLVLIKEKTECYYLYGRDDGRRQLNPAILGLPLLVPEFLHFGKGNGLQ